MYIETNSALLQQIIFQLSATRFESSVMLESNAQANLLEIRDLMALRLITGVFNYRTISDPSGPLLVSADRILLTAQEILFLSPQKIN